MKLNVRSTVLSLAVIFSAPAIAAPSINDMQSCQGVLDFVSQKLDSAPSNYPAADVSAVQKGLAQYDDYIQQTIVTPGLVNFNGGDSAKADVMQKQVDAYKATLVTGFNKRYPESRLYMDHAVMVNDCAKKAVPSGQALENLKTTLNTIIKLAKMN